MKKLIVFLLLLCLVPLVRADDTPASDTVAAAPAQADEKAAAMAIHDQLKAIYSSGDTSAASWDALDAKIAGYQKTFGVTTQTTHNVVALRAMELGVAKRLDPARFQTLLKTLQSDPLPEMVAMVQEVQAKEDRMANLKTKPVDLKFTAVDGQAVDLAQLRGKVVLVDFWATWCPPCREEVPNVVATYKKYHDQGFEIVGISLDKDKDALLAFTKEQGMVWPQYFDGQGWQNKISTGFEINSIPAMWLIDKKGMLVTTDGREDLAGQVEKLLAAP